MICIKIHKAYRKIIAVCDPELLGKKFVEDQLQLDLTSEFYKSDKIEEDKAIKIMKAENSDDSTFNIVGEKSIAAAIKAGIIKDDKEAIIKVQGIPHALGLF